MSSPGDSRLLARLRLLGAVPTDMGFRGGERGIWGLAFWAALGHPGDLLGRFGSTFDGLCVPFVTLWGASEDPEGYGDPFWSPG